MRTPLVMSLRDLEASTCDGSVVLTTWRSGPNSRKVIQEALHGAPEPEIRAILGENAARVYGFDLAMLDRIAAEVGPTIADI